MVRKTPILANPQKAENADEPVAPVESATVPQQKEESEDETEIPLQVPKVKAKLNKPYVQTERQKEATRKMKEALEAKHRATREAKAREAEERKKQIEEKVIKKALSIKKKQIKQQLALDEISDDDTPIEEILPVRRKTVSQPVQQVQQVQKPQVQQKPQQRIIFL